MPVTKYPGDSIQVDITIENTGNVSYDFQVNCSIVGLIDFTPQTITLDPNQQGVVTFQGNIPSDASQGSYDVYVSVGNGTQIFDEQTLSGEVSVMGKRVIFRTNNPDLMYSTNPNLDSNTWIAVDMEFWGTLAGCTNPNGLEGGFYRQTFNGRTSGDVFIVLPNGFEVLKRDACVAQNGGPWCADINIYNPTLNVTYRFYNIASSSVEECWQGIETSPEPVEPYASQGLEVYA